MKINTFQGGFDKNFSYLIWCEKTNIASVVDPAVPIAPMVETIEKYNLILDKILITHTHHDHIFYLEDWVHLFPNVQIICSNKTINEQFEFHPIDHNEIITVGEEIFICLYTPGHFYNSTCYWNKNKKILFTGDTVFVGRTGRTKDPQSNIKDLYNSIYNIILKLPQDTMVYPGHHYGYVKFISIKDNIICSDFFKCKTFNQFKKVMDNFELKR